MRWRVGLSVFFTFRLAIFVLSDMSAFAPNVKTMICIQKYWIRNNLVHALIQMLAVKTLFEDDHG
jgi:hypothetical protein